MSKKRMDTENKDTKAEDMEIIDMETNENSTENNGKKKFRINIHLVFAALVILFVAIIASKFIGFGKYISQDDIAAIPAPENPEIQAYDDFRPLMAEDDGTFPKDDGITTVVCLGNAFSDERNSDNNLCSLFAKETGATVYNCSIPDSHMSSLNYTFLADDYPMDAFSFYWLTTAFTVDNEAILDTAMKAMEEVPEELEESVKLLQSIDFETVDAIFIMYDGSDYLDNRPIFNDANFTDIQHFTGAMAAGIELIQETYPWIRIIVMSPTYAFGVEEDGSYISSDIKSSDYGFLSTYVIMQYSAADVLNVSFLDNLYGSIHEDIAKEYLTDNLHLNQKGRELVAARMKEALEKYTTIY